MHAKGMWLVISCVGAMGCGAAPGSAGGEGDGLTVERMEARGYTRAAYRMGERVVYIETRRAEKTPDEYRAVDPSLPTYGVDVRVTDASGSLIYARIAGDGADFAEDDAPAAAPELRKKDIAAARAGVAALAGHARGLTTAGAAAGVTPLVGFADSATLEQAQVLDEAGGALDNNGADSAADADSGEIEGGELGAEVVDAAATYKHRIELWKAHCCVPGGWHSATRMDSSLNGTTWNNRVDWCNHGRCPQGEGMTEDCSYTSGWRSGKARAQMCTTGYNVTSTFRSHNCNDDSHLEVIDVRHNKLYSTDDGSCHDIGANPNPDGCDPSTW